MDVALMHRAAKATLHCRPTALMLVGSAVHAPQSARDIDFLLLDEREKEVIGPELEYAFGIARLKWLGRSDDVFRAASSLNEEISIALLSPQTIREEIESFREGLRVEGERRFWAPGCRLPEGFAGDVLHANVLEDQEEILPELKSWLNPYPPAARKAILDYSLKEFRLKSEALERAEDGVASAILLGDVTVALVRIAAATESVYLRNLKNTTLLAPMLKGRGKEILERAYEIARSGKDRSKLSDTLRSAASACGL